tara:strand:- start:484 stop:873 length:390 start_codon:yes stop_codon:yes gene_type:complete
MSYDKSTVVSFKADEAISEFQLVSVKDNGKLVVTEAATDARCVGVAQRSCNAGDMVDVVILGLTRAIAGGSITFNTSPLVMATSNGKIAAHATTGNYSIGRVIANVNQLSASANEQIVIVFTGANNLVP